jgi:hypothetical protein
VAHLTGDQQAIYQILQEDRFADAERFYMADIGELNGSGAQAQAILTIDEDTNTLTVVISAKGVEAGLVHPQHIHGFLDGRDANVPTSAVDVDQDGFIELAEGAETYGPVLLSLTSPPGGELSGFPTAPDGSYLFSQTYQLPAGDLPADPMLWLREIVVHGMTVPDGVGNGTPGEVDGTNGYLPTLPIAAGEIEEISSAEAFGMFRAIAEGEFDGAARADRRELNRELRDEQLDYSRTAFRNAIDDVGADVQGAADDLVANILSSVRQSLDFGGGWSFS